MLEFFNDAAEHAATYADMVLASGSSSNGDAVYLLLLGPIAGIGFYTFIFLRYRNTDKRYEYEHRTSSEIGGPRGNDTKVNSIHGTSKKRIDGDNSRDPRRRLGPNTTMKNG